MGKHSTRGGLFGDKRPSGSSRAHGRRSPGSVGRPIHGVRTLHGDHGTLSDPKQRRTGPLEHAPAKLRAERERRQRKVRRGLAFTGMAVLALVVVGALGMYAYAKRIENTLQKTVTKTEKLDVNLVKAKPQEPYNLLIMGFDRRPGETVFRSDTMILAHVDPKTREMWMLSLPRDMRVDIPGHGTNKMNNAYALGQEELAIKTVQEFTGVPIHHFVAVNFNGFKRAVNAMGGVWVDVPVEIDDWKADRSPGHRAKHIDPGYQLLDGEHALTFVRSRDFPDADITRMKHQQLFFKAIADQVANRTSIVKLPRIISSVAPYISTDMSLIEMMRTAQALKGAGSKNLYTATLPGEWKSPYIYPDEEGIQALIDKMNQGVPFEPKKPAPGETTQTAGAASTTQAGAAETPEKIEPTDVSVTIRNGAGIAGCAKQASSILKARGFEVGEVGNANQFVYDKTLVVYKDKKQAAELVTAAMPSGVKLVQSRGMYSFSTDVLIVIGKDWDLAKVPVTPVLTD